MRVIVILAARLPWMGKEGLLVGSIDCSCGLYSTSKNHPVTEVNKENEVNEVTSKKIKIKCQHMSCVQSGCAWQVQCGYATVDRRTDKGGRNRWRVEFTLYEAVSASLEVVSIQRMPGSRSLLLFL